METAVPDESQPPLSQRRRGQGWVHLGAAGQDYVAELQARFKDRLPPTNGANGPGGDCGNSKPSGPPRCPECNWEIKPGVHGWLATGEWTHDDKYGNVYGIRPCPSCAGAVARRRQFERFRALMAESRLPKIAEQWTFDSFPQHPGKREALKDAAAFARGDMRQAFTSLYLYGSYGGGKTGLALCILRARLEQTQPGLFWAMPDLLSRIKQTYDARNEDTENALIRQLVDVDFLVLDDLGAEKASEWQREKLYQIVNGRMLEGRETVYTSNFSPVDIAQHVGQRVADRIEYRCLPSEVGGANLRRD